MVCLLFPSIYTGSQVFSPKIKKLFKMYNNVLDKH